MKVLLSVFLVLALTLPVMARPIWHNDGWIADINGDGFVDVVDLGILSKNYDKSWPAPVPGGENWGAWNAGDRTNDNRVDVRDLAILARYYDDAWFYYSWPVTVPEPCALILAVLGGSIIVGKPRYG
jgi:hypothetical protein